MSEVEGIENIDWKWLNEEHKYKVFKDGKIYSAVSEQFMKLIKQKHRDVFMITLVKDGKDYKTQVHTLIYRLFIGNISNKLYVGYKDGNYKNFNVDNLKLVSRKELTNNTIKRITDEENDAEGVENINWKYLNDEKKYKVYKDGRIYSNYEKKYMKLIDNWGDIYVSIMVKEKKSTYVLFKIIYNLFVGEIPNYNKIIFIDNNYKNVSLENLKLVSKEVIITRNIKINNEIKINIDSLDKSNDNKVNNSITTSLKINELDMEFWKPIKNYEDKYLISKSGEIISKTTGKIMQDNHSKKYKDAYISIGLSNDVNHKILKVHMLVYCTFNNVDIKDLGKDVIDHINRNRKDNRLENLRRISKSENAKNRGDIPYKEVSQEVKSNNFVIIGKYEKYEFNNYKINEYGDIFSLLVNKVIAHHIQVGYHIVKLLDNITKKKFSIKVHRLVATVFVKNPNNYPVINHINEKRGDNYYTNLEWTTHKENISYSNQKEIVKLSMDDKLIDIYACSTEAFISIELNKTKKYSFRINEVCKGKRNYAYDYKWKYFKDLTEDEINKLKELKPDKLQLINKFINKYKHRAENHTFIDTHINENREIRKKIVQLSLDNKVLNIFKTSVDAFKHLGKQSCGDIVNICKRKFNRLIAYGFNWKYLTDLTEEEKNSIPEEYKHHLNN